MRPRLIAGILILCLGGFLILRGGTFTKKHDVVKVGDVKITANERKSIPSWVGWAAIIVGLGVLTVGTWRKP